MRKRILWMSVLVMVLSRVISRAEIVTMDCIADSWVMRSDPDATAATDSSLWTRGDVFGEDARAVLRFDLSAIPPGAIINRAQLELHLNRSEGGPGMVEVWTMDDGWDERAVNWRTLPRPDSLVADGAFDLPAPTDVSIDLLTLVGAWRSSSTELVLQRSLSLRGPASTHAFAFDSREGGQRPRLVVDYTPTGPFGTVMVTIGEARAFYSGEDSIFSPNAPQDFYVKVSIDDGPLVTKGYYVDDKDHASWTPALQWVQTVVKGKRFYPVRIELWDYDSGSDDDWFDLSPQGQKELKLLFDACTGTWTEEGRAQVYNQHHAVMMPDSASGLECTDCGQVLVNISTGDGRSFAPNDVSIRTAGPIQAVEDAHYVIDGKATAFLLQLASTWTVERRARVTVTLDDRVSRATDIKEVIVPPEGLKAYFFDGSGTASPFTPRRYDNDPYLRYSVQVEVDAAEEPLPPWFNCVGENNAIFDAAVKVIRTTSHRVRYVGWDFADSGLPPSAALFEATAQANEDFRAAIFPIDLPVRIREVTDHDYRTRFHMLEPSWTMMEQSWAAPAMGVDKLVLMPRQGWFGANASRLTFGDSAIGLSLGEYAPHAVIAEAGFPHSAVHEIGHTYAQSQHPCSTATWWEEFFGVNCRDEYKHSAADHYPYLGHGYDVEGRIYPFGAGLAPTPDTREVDGVSNFMDNEPGRVSPGGVAYGRWIDTFTFNDLSERLRRDVDPEMLSIGGFIQAVNGLPAVNPGFEGRLLDGYRLMGVPDFAPATPGKPSGQGAFSIRLKTPAGDFVYRFTPGFRPTQDQGDFGFFAFTIPWASNVTSLELVGPSSIYPTNSQEIVLASKVRTTRAPKVGNLRVSVDNSTPVTQGQVIEPNQVFTLSWKASDDDSSTLTASAFIAPEPAQGSDPQWLPYGMHLTESQLTLSANQFASAPGMYRARILLSDGLNSATIERAGFFEIKAITPPVIVQQPQDILLKEDGIFLLYVRVESAEPPTFQWLKNGTAISGAISSYFGVTNATGADAGVYSVIVSNRGGSVRSSNARVIVKTFWPATPLGAAVLVPTLDGLFVGNLGASGADGVALSLGASVDSVAEFAGVTLNDWSVGNLTEGSSLTVRAVGTVDALDKQTLASMQAIKAGDGIDLTVEFALPLTVPLQATLYDGETIVSTARGLTGVVAHVTGLIGNAEWRPYQPAHGIPQAWLNFTSRTPVSLPGGGSSFGTRLMVTPDALRISFPEVAFALPSWNPFDIIPHTGLRYYFRPRYLCPGPLCPYPGVPSLVHFGPVARLEILGRGIAQLTVRQRQSGLFGQLHEALPGTDLDVLGDHLSVAPQTTGTEFGFATEPGLIPEGSAGVSLRQRLAYVGSPLPAVGAFLKTGVRGSLNGGPNQFLATLETRRSGSNTVQLRIEATPFGTNRFTASILRGGLLVHTAPVNGGLIASISGYAPPDEVGGGWDQRCGVPVPPPDCWRINLEVNWRSELPFKLSDGGVVFGDQIIVQGDPFPQPNLKFEGLGTIFGGGWQDRVLVINENVAPAGTFFAGLTVQPVGASNFEQDSNSLSVVNTGTNAEYGVSIPFGDSDSGTVECAGLGDASVPNGSALSVAAFGTVDGLPDQLLGKIIASQAATNLKFTYVPLGPFSAQGATDAMIVVYDGEQLVDASEATASPTVTMALSEDRWIAQWRMLSHSQWAARIESPQRTVIALPGRPPVFGTSFDFIECRVCDHPAPQPDLPEISAISRLKLTGQGLSRFRLRGVRAGAYRQSVAVMGSARIAGQGDEWVFDQLGSTSAMPAGVRFDWQDHVDQFSAWWRPLNAWNQLRKGALVQISSHGRSGDGAELSLGFVQIMHNGQEPEIGADFSAMGASALRVEVWRNHQSVKSIVLNGSVATPIESSQWPVGAGQGKVGTNQFFFWLRYLEGATFYLGNASVKGDELRLVPENPSRAFDRLSDVRLEGSGLDGFSLIYADSRSSRLPTLRVLGTGGTIALTWSPASAQQSLQSADEPNGDWIGSGPSGPPFLTPAIDGRRYFRLVQP